LIPPKFQEINHKNKKCKRKRFSKLLHDILGFNQNDIGKLLTKNIVSNFNYKPKEENKDLDIFDSKSKDSMLEFSNRNINKDHIPSFLKKISGYHSIDYIKQNSNNNDFNLKRSGKSNNEDKKISYNINPISNNNMFICNEYIDNHKVNSFLELKLNSNNKPIQINKKFTNQNSLYDIKYKLENYFEKDQDKDFIKNRNYKFHIKKSKNFPNSEFDIQEKIGNENINNFSKNKSTYSDVTFEKEKNNHPIDSNILKSFLSQKQHQNKFELGKYQNISNNSEIENLDKIDEIKKFNSWNYYKDKNNYKLSLVKENKLQDNIPKNNYIFKDIIYLKNSDSKNNNEKYDFLNTRNFTKKTLNEIDNNDIDFNNSRKKIEIITIEDNNEKNNYLNSQNKKLDLEENLYNNIYKNTDKNVGKILKQSHKIMKDKYKYKNNKLMNIDKILNSSINEFNPFSDNNFNIEANFITNNKNIFLKGDNMKISKNNDYECSIDRFEEKFKKDFYKITKNNDNKNDSHLINTKNENLDFNLYVNNSFITQISSENSSNNNNNSKNYFSNNLYKFSSCDHNDIENRKNEKISNIIRNKITNSELNHFETIKKFNTSDAIKPSKIYLELNQMRNVPNNDPLLLVTAEFDRKKKQILSNKFRSSNTADSNNNFNKSTSNDSNEFMRNNINIKKETNFNSANPHNNMNLNNFNSVSYLNSNFNRFTNKNKNSNNFNNKIFENDIYSINNKNRNISNDEKDNNNYNNIQIYFNNTKTHLNNNSNPYFISKQNSLNKNQIFFPSEIKNLNSIYHDNSNLIKDIYNEIDKITDDDSKLNINHENLSLKNNSNKSKITENSLDVLFD